MYAGTSLTRYSGRVMGAHQKIDRVARRHLSKILGDKNFFPKISEILVFEGKNGPDAIKRKSPAKDEPWHYYSPFNNDDSGIIVLIQNHYDLLVKELKADNHERASFEAAWLAHALVDGLTPAHHYPYEEKLVELRGGEGIETRTTYKDKLLMPGDTRKEQVQNNWKMWGPKGLLTAHMFFEFGVAGLLKPLSFNDSVPTPDLCRKVLEVTPIELFRRIAREIAILNMYDRYLRRGWTVKLSYDVRHKLGPLIIQTVTLTWYAALVDAGLIKKPKKT